MSRKQIGTVRILRDRVYALDPAAALLPSAADVIVPAGEYPVYQDGMSRYWRMTGVLNHRHYRMGDGAFSMSDRDERSDDDVVFYSQRFGPDEWAGLMEAPGPALEFSVTEDASS